MGGSGGDFGLALAVPLYDGGFGDLKAAADAGQAEALDAETEEFVAGRLWVHRGKGLNH